MIDKDGFEYVPIVLGTSYLLPQIYKGYKTKQLTDISTISILMLISASMLWAYYLYAKIGEEYFAYATGFITFNAVIILCMKYTYYVMHLKDKIKEIDENRV